MALEIDEVVLRLGCRFAIRLSRKANARQHISRQGLQIGWLQARILGRVDGLLHGSFGLSDRRRRFPIQLSQLSGWRLRLLCSLRFGSGPLSFLLPLKRCRSSGLRHHLPEGLPDLFEAALLVSQFIRQLAAQAAFAVLAVLLGVQDRGLADQVVDLILQILLSTEQPLVAHGRVLAGIGLNLGTLNSIGKGHHVGDLEEPQDLNKQTLERIEVASAKNL